MSDKVLTFILAVLYILTTTSADCPPCPPKDKIDPCFCICEHLTIVFCHDFNGIHKLNNILENIKGWNVSLTSDYLRLGDIPSDFFEGHTFEELNLIESVITSFGDPPFIGLENTLKEVDVVAMRDENKYNLEAFTLGHLKKLKHLRIEGYYITKLGNEWFGNSESLAELLLESNRIEELGDRVFASLINVDEISLANNLIKEISRSMFPQPAKLLTYLTISLNQIETLPDNIFIDMPALTSVNLKGNKLKSLPESTWGNIFSQLNSLRVENNEEFQCDEKLKWLYGREWPRLRYIFGQCRDSKLEGKWFHELVLDDFE